MKTVKLRSLLRFIPLIFLPVLLFLINGGCNYFLPNKPPYVERISPADSAIYAIGQVVDFLVNAYDVDGRVTKVVFTPPNTSVTFIDSVPPYEFSWQTAGLAEGNYDMEIKAVDNKDDPYIVKAPIKLRANPTPNAGKDTTYTDSRLSCMLDAGVPSSGQGTWSIISGTGGQILDIHNPKATLTGITCQTYTLRWTVSNGVMQLSDEVTIGFSYQPGKANAGVNQLISDGRTSAILQAVQPTDGSGHWRILTGNSGSFNDAALPNATFTGQACNTYSLVWSISTPCAVTSDTVEIRFDPYLINPNAGPNQSFTDGRMSAILAANSATVGTGTWSIISGQNGHFATTSDPRTTFIGQLCQVYVLRWTLSTPCASRSDDVTITFDYFPTPANAGPDLNISGPVRSVVLSGNGPEKGTGTWSLVTGSGGTFEDINNPQSRFTGEPCQTYGLRWTISTSCHSSSDQMTVSFTDLSSISNAGADQNLTDGSIYTQLNATPPVNGTGLWSVISGGTGNFSDRGDPRAIFTGSICHSYVLRWTVSTSCNSSFDEVTIVFNQVAISADAGADVRISDGSLATFLHGNSPGTATLGTWSIMSGQGGNVEEINNPGSRFTGVSGQIYILKWLFTSACMENSDLVTISFTTSLEMFDPRDEKTYQAIKIGNQTWMAENLNYSISGSYSYDNSSTTPSYYGRLYDWTTALTACPSGWHLSTDLEWRQLEIFLGMDATTTLLEWYRGLNEGGMLKEVGTVLWQSPNAGATNITGFTARPGGYRTPTGVFGGVNTHAGFWTTSGNTNGQAIYRTLHKDKSQIGRDWYEKGYAFSVRCVKN